MSYLLFIDESGHDHKTCPYEVRGGFALHAGRLWPFVRAVSRLEEAVFGGRLHSFGEEIKGAHLLDKDRFRWAAQAPDMNDQDRRDLSLRFLQKGVQKAAPTRSEFSAFGQACIAMAEGVFELLQTHEATLFASAIPRGVRKPNALYVEDFLRKDFVFLLERYFYFLDEKQEHGLLVMDETEVSSDRRLARQMERYYTRTSIGLTRATWVVPSPVFVSSEMTYAVQAADICLYCINWGFRRPESGMNAPTRPEIQDRFADWLERLQYHGRGTRDGIEYFTSGIVHVPDPYTARK